MFQYWWECLPYGDEFVDAKYKTADKSYLEAFNNYIGAEIVLSGKDAISVLVHVKKQKRDVNNLFFWYSN